MTQPQFTPLKPTTPTTGPALRLTEPDNGLTGEGGAPVFSVGDGGTAAARPRSLAPADQALARAMHNVLASAAAARHAADDGLASGLEVGPGDMPADALSAATAPSGSEIDEEPLIADGEDDAYQVHFFDEVEEPEFVAHVDPSTPPLPANQPPAAPSDAGTSANAPVAAVYPRLVTDSPEPHGHPLGMPPSAVPNVDDQQDDVPEESEAPTDAERDIAGQAAEPVVLFGRVDNDQAHCVADDGDVCGPESTDYSDETFSTHGPAEFDDETPSSQIAEADPLEQQASMPLEVVVSAVSRLKRQLGEMMARSMSSLAASRAATRTGGRADQPQSRVTALSPVDSIDAVLQSVEPDLQGEDDSHSSGEANDAAFGSETLPDTPSSERLSRSAVVPPTDSTDESDEEDDAPEPAGASSGAIWSIPLMCAGIALVACCVVIPQSDANRRLVYERTALRAELDQVQEQVSTNDEFLRRLAGDPTLAERLAQRQLKLQRAGTKLLPVNADTGTSPFDLVAVPPPPSIGPYQPVQGRLSVACRDPKTRLYLTGAALFALATGLVLGGGSRAKSGSV